MYLISQATVAGAAVRQTTRAGIDEFVDRRASARKALSARLLVDAAQQLHLAIDPAPTNSVITALQLAGPG